jgi:hypothetical protein
MALAGLPLAVGAWAEAKRDVILCFDGSGPLDKWRRVGPEDSRDER